MTRWTSEHWVIPVVASIMYLLMITFLKKYMATQEKMRLQPVVIAWNFGLSAFSIGGLMYCVPHLLFNERSGVLTAGFYPSVCSHASAYGFGEVGFWVFLFIYSKLAELVDTLWLLLRKSPVILLHWYHHVTVLLYCWHAYSVRQDKHTPTRGQHSHRATQPHRRRQRPRHTRAPHALSFALVLRARALSLRCASARASGSPR